MTLTLYEECVLAARFGTEALRFAAEALDAYATNTSTSRARTLNDVTNEASRILRDVLPIIPEQELRPGGEILRYASGPEGPEPEIYGWDHLNSLTRRLVTASLDLMNGIDVRENVVRGVVYMLLTLSVEDRQRVLKDALGVD